MFESKKRLPNTATESLLARKALVRFWMERANEGAQLPEHIRDEVEWQIAQGKGDSQIDD